MNYIKRLQSEVSEAETKANEVDEVVTELYSYLNSSKFFCGDELDGYVNIKDIMTYLDRMRLIQ